MSNTTLKQIIGVNALVLGVALAVILGLARHSGKPVLFYYGGGAEVPDGTAISIMNPFRDRTSERVAQSLVSNFSGSDCQKIASAFRSDPSTICPTTQRNNHAILIWRKDSPESRLLVYSLQEQHARLWITFRREETGFEVSSLSLLK